MRGHSAWLAAGTAGAAIALASCAPPHPHARPPLRAVSRLDCPQTQGALNRQGASADGNSCLYTDKDGDAVTLQLVSLDGKEAAAALAPIETQLRAELPGVTGGGPPPPAPPGASSDGNSDGGKKDDKVDIDLPGLHIHTGGGGHSQIDAAGVHVDAEDGPGHSGDHATVRIGGDGRGVNVIANDGGAEIRIHEKGSGVRARFILASDKPGPHGYRTAGYEARGPSGGPLVVASVLAKSGDHDALREDIHDLVAHNVGG